MGQCLSINKSRHGHDSAGLADGGNLGGGVGNSGIVNNSVGLHAGLNADTVTGVVGGSIGADGLTGHSGGHHHNHPGAHHVRNNPSSLPPLPDSDNNAQVCLFCFFLFMFLTKMLFVYLFASCFEFDVCPFFYYCELCLNLSFI